MNFSIKKIVAGALAGLMLINIPLTVEAGGFGFGGGGGGFRSGGSSGGFRSSGGSSGFRMSSGGSNSGFRASSGNSGFRANSGNSGFRANSGNTFRSSQNLNLGHVNRAPAFRSNPVVRTNPVLRNNNTAFRGVVTNSNRNVLRTTPRINPGFRTPVRHNPFVNKSPVLRRNIAGSTVRRSATWQRGVVVRGQGGKIWRRPNWIGTRTLGTIAWLYPFHRCHNGHMTMNCCTGITPYVATDAVYETEGLASVDDGANQFSGAEIKISCGPNMPGNVGYMLNGTEFDMQPGYSQKFAEDRVWVIQFRSGDENSDVVEYTLTAGEYQFVVVDGKLNLTPVTADGIDPNTPDAGQNSIPDDSQQQFGPDGAPIAP